MGSVPADDDVGSAGALLRNTTGPLAAHLPDAAIPILFADLRLQRRREHDIGSPRFGAGAEGPGRLLARNA
jgi:hypothetical protein